MRASILLLNFITTATAIPQSGGLFSGLFGGGSPSSSGSGSFGDLLAGVAKNGFEVNDVLCQMFKDPNSLLTKTIETMFGSPNGPGPDEKCAKDTSGGSGPYKAGFVVDPTLPDHTIYVQSLHQQTKSFQ